MGRYFIIFLCLIAFIPCSAFTEEWEILWTEDFEDGILDRWDYTNGWSIVDQETKVLQGNGNEIAIRPYSDAWKDYEVSFKLLLKQGGISVYFRNLGEFDYETFYKITFNGENLELWKNWAHLTTTAYQLHYQEWYDISIQCMENRFLLKINDEEILSYTDNDNPYSHGRFKFSTIGESIVQIDDIQVKGKLIIPGVSWYETGGPSGGKGYDVRISPLDKNTMFVTDNPSGVNKSIDGGKTWYASNKGILGDSYDEVPIFSLTIDPHNPNIIWAGFERMKGLFKSTDNGETWELKINGLTDNNNLTTRGITIHPNGSDTVFLGCEVIYEQPGMMYSKGKIFRTVNGGDLWETVYEGNALVRFVLINKNNPNICYASTGIFDGSPAPEDSLGVGVLKSTDGGKSWFRINNGFSCLFIGYLEMHPENPDIIYAAAGGENIWLNNQLGKENTAHETGGLYRTLNGGENWEELIHGDLFTLVIFSPSNSDIIYAGSDFAFYRSDDGGESWNKYYSQEVDGKTIWGPPGIRAGVPIGGVVHPDDPMTVFVNNYQGGVFISRDGGETWINSSQGYTGAQTYDITVDPVNPARIYFVGRSGPFYSLSGGDSWKGMAYSPAIDPEWLIIRVNPLEPSNILMSNQGGKIFFSNNYGLTWETALAIQSTGFTAISYSPSNPETVYAASYGENSIARSSSLSQSVFGVYKSIDSGKNWDFLESTNSPEFQYPTYLLVSPEFPNSVFLATETEGIMYSHDGGATWNAKNNGLPSAHVSCLDYDRQNPGHLYAGLSDGKGIYKSTDNGNSWFDMNTNIKLTCPSFFSPIGKNQGISLSPPPLLPPLTAKHQLKNYHNQIPWTHINSIAVNPVNSDEIFAADAFNGVYYSQDNGKSWAFFNTGLNIMNIQKLAFSHDGKVIYAGSWGKGVYRLTIENIPPNIISIYPDSSSVFILQGDSLLFSVNACDLNGDSISYSWYLNDEFLESSHHQLSLKTQDIPLGNYTLKVVIRDQQSAAENLWNITITDPVDLQEKTISDDKFQLLSYYPNPFQIHFNILIFNPRPSTISVQLFSILGQKVIEKFYQRPQGKHKITVDFDISDGDKLPNGFYLCKIKNMCKDHAEEIIIPITRIK